MVIYTCLTCNKEFKQKSHYIDHTENKKKPCKQIKNVIVDNITIDSDLTPKSSEMTPKYSKKHNNDSEMLQNDSVKPENNKNICLHCLKTFSKSSNLSRHLNEGRCKVKILEDEKKQNIFENLIEKDKKIDEIINKFSILEENNKNLQENNKNLQENNKNLQVSNKNLVDLTESLKNKNDELFKKNKELEMKINKILNKNTNNVQNITNNTQNITNNNIIYKINPFNEETFKKLDRKEILKIMTDTDNNGVFCFNKLIKMIHFNNKIPENQNIYMNDYNRGLYMIHDGTQWNLRKDEEFIIFSVLEHVRDLFNEYNDEEFEEKLEKDINFSKNFQTTFKKYFDYVYDEVEDKDLDEKELKKKKEFKMKMDKEVKNGLYNYRHIPQKNAELLENLINNQIIKIDLLT